MVYLYMLRIPQSIFTHYQNLLNSKKIEQKYHPHYIKWLRYYLDFCKKYEHENISTKSLNKFINKLQEKKQTQFQQIQARHAISIYYDLVQKPAAPTEKEIDLKKRVKRGDRHFIKESKEISLMLGAIVSKMDKY